MRNEWLKIRGVYRRQFCPATDRDGGDHAISQTSRAASGLVEKFGGKFGVGRKKIFS
jgi:hypothetical protein